MKKQLKLELQKLIEGYENLIHETEWAMKCANQDGGEFDYDGMKAENLLILENFKKALTK